MNTKHITIITIAILLLQTATAFSQSVGINEDGSEPDSRAILDVKSSSKGVIMPRLTDAERDALYQDVPEGMIIYNTTDQQLQIFMNNQWFPLSMGTPEDAPELTVTDEDGNVYSTVQIGDQVWMAENLKTTTYNDGTSIDLVTYNTAWENNATGAYCWYDNDSTTYADTYGALYNWYAVNTGNLCPDGWHVPTDAEWNALEAYIASDGHSGTEGTALKATSGWYNDGNGTDDYGFSALPGGRRLSNGSFYHEGDFGYYWSSTENGSIEAWGRRFSYSSSDVTRSSYRKENGFSVRCLRD